MWDTPHLTWKHCSLLPVHTLDWVLTHTLFRVDWGNHVTIYWTLKFGLPLWQCTDNDRHPNFPVFQWCLCDKIKVWYQATCLSQFVVLKWEDKTQNNKSIIQLHTNTNVYLLNSTANVDICGFHATLILSALLYLRGKYCTFYSISSHPHPLLPLHAVYFHFSAVFLDPFCTCSIRWTDPM